MLASSNEPLKNSDPPCEPITTGAELVIEPILTDFEKVCPSTISLIAEEVLTHWTVCHLPLFNAGPAVSAPLLDALEAARGLPVGLVLHLELAAAGVDVPLRIRSQSGACGALVALRWMVTVMSLLPAFRSLADGTVT